jgi:hypothetical protein
MKFELTKRLEGSPGRGVYLVEINIAVQTDNLIHGLPCSARLPWSERIDREEAAAIRLVPSVQNKLIEPGTVTASAYLDRAAAVTIVRKAAKVNAASGGAEEVRNEVGRSHWY